MVSNSTASPTAELKREPSVCHDVGKKSLQTGTVVFILGFVWHIRILPWIYSIGGRDWMAAISLYGDQAHAFKERLDLDDPNVSREFGLMGAVTHTVVFIFGLICATVLRRVRHTYQRIHKAKIEPMSVSASLLLVIWSGAVFHSMAWYVLRYCFEAKFGKIYQFAQVFFNEHGESPFAWVSSVSYTSALLLGFLLSLEDHSDRFQRVILPSETLRSWAVWIMLPFLVWITTLDTVTVPFYQELFVQGETNGSVDSEIPAYLLEETLRDEKGVAFLVGLTMCSLVPTMYTLVKAVGLTIGLTIKSEGVPRAGLLNEAIAWSKEVIHTFIVSSALAWFLLTLAMQTDQIEAAFEIAETAKATLYATVLSSKTIKIAFALCTFYATILYLVLGKVPFINSMAKGITTYMSLLLLWNCHLVFFFGSFMPFHIWAAASELNLIELRKPYSQLDALFDALCWVGFGSYIGPVVMKGTVKVFSVKLKSPWGFKQDCIMAAICFIPLTIMLWLHWTNDTPGLPIFLGLTGIHLFYLMTWKDKPEYSGNRQWDEFVSWLQLLLRLIEDYFDFSISVFDVDLDKPLAENCYRDSFAEDRPRIFGFHPHGMYPCSVIWAPLSRRFRQAFGRLKIYTMTDAFTHVVPAMREFCQYTGGREVSKQVVSEMLTKKKTIMLVPGGQGEIMLHTREDLDGKIISLCAKHKGFVRMALQHNAELVPTFNFGELHAIENIYLPRIQNLGRKIFGFPLPFFPVGIWGFLPIPRKVKMTWVIGKPIKCRAGVPGKPTEDEVTEIHRQYFMALRDLIDTHKVAVGYGEFKVIYKGLDI